jgi:UDP-N-acetylmuramoyl-L-alanyl-D-glutamate--2,6-diaminopimelate ligase
MASSGKTMSALAGLVRGTLVGDGDALITDVTHDSHNVRPGSLFVAVRGARLDGHGFIPRAVEAGAGGLCVDHQVAVEVPQLLVDDTRGVMGELAAAVHGHPSADMDVIGVTGTNGKTTVTHFIDSIAGGAGRLTGLVGTIRTVSSGSSSPATLTTPEASDFQRLLAGMRDEGVDLVSAEVSSHALELGRVRGTRFSVAAFTNLSQDHLDFHGDMDSYREAKSRLFTDYEVGTAVFNIDDPTGAELAAGYRGDVITVGRHGDISVHAIETHPSFSTFSLGYPLGEADVRAPVIGEFNVSNLVLAGACCFAVGIDYEVVFDAMSRVPGVPGRFELVSGDDQITVIVDYAHTPAGVATAVETARRMTRGQVIALIGAGGDRDRAKRPAMGSAVSKADLAVITSDNPRSEDPEEIARAVLSGVEASAADILDLDRRSAIDRAIDAARDGDVVLILGRGHEPMQDLGSVKVPFDDREVAVQSLRRRRSAESGAGSGSMSP